MNETVRLITNRTSLRKYAAKPISHADRDTIIESALRAPTAGNMMLYSIIVVDDQEKKNVLGETCDHQPFIAEAPLVMVFLADMQRWFDYYEVSRVKEYCRRAGQVFTGPTEADLLLAGSDALIAAQTAAIAAESLGIGSCYIGDIMENYETHRDLFNLPPWAFPIAMLVMGYYPETRPMLKPRFDRRYIVYTNQYHALTEQDLADMVADRSKDFTPENRYAAENFAQLMYARKTGAKFSKEMVRSVRKALENWRGQVL